MLMYVQMLSATCVCADLQVLLLLLPHMKKHVRNNIQQWSNENVETLYAWPKSGSLVCILLSTKNVFKWDEYFKKVVWRFPLQGDTWLK